MTDKELETLKNLFANYNHGVFSEFTLGTVVASLLASGEISKDSYQKICDYFGACVECRVLEYVPEGFVNHKIGLPKETMDFINLFLEGE
jgi:hypothetical protein